MLVIMKIIVFLGVVSNKSAVSIVKVKLNISGSVQNTNILTQSEKDSYGLLQRHFMDM